MKRTAQQRRNVRSRQRPLQSETEAGEDALSSLNDLPTAIPGAHALRPAPTVLPEMAEIRAHIAGNSKGVTRDDTIVREVAKILHAKTFDEQRLRAGKSSNFYFLQGESAEQVAERLAALLKEARVATPRGGNTLSWKDQETLVLDAESVAFAVAKLQHVSVLASERDVLGEAFESLIGPSLRGSEGQFFTPRNLVQMCVRMVDPQPTERIIDPACGAGGFLGETLSHLNGSSRKVARNSAVVGIDKDAFLATLCLDHLALYQRSHQVFCDNSLDLPVRWSPELQQAAPLNSFDVVLTNPPFGAAIPVKGTSLLRQYELAWRWKRTKTGDWTRTDTRKESRPPQVLFIERCLQLLRPGGRAAIVLPEGIFGNESEGYIRQWVLRHAELLAIVDCPLETFLPSTPTKTCVLFIRKHDTVKNGDSPSVFMAIAERCGHDRRGKPLYRDDGSRDDDFPSIADSYLQGSRKRQ